jgi:hypothetical protein
MLQQPLQDSDVLLSFTLIVVELAITSFFSSNMKIMFVFEALMENFPSNCLGTVLESL